MTLLSNNSLFFRTIGQFNMKLAYTSLILVILSGCSPYYDVSASECSSLATNAEAYMEYRLDGYGISNTPLYSNYDTPEYKKADYYTREQAFDYKIKNNNKRNLIISDFSTEIYKKCMNSGGL